MSGPSLAPYILRRPWLKTWMMPFANWYANAAGYRRLGLRYDDLIPEENDTMQLALKRLPPKEAYDRVFRLRRAFQCSLAHQLLPPAEWTKPEEDQPYLSQIIKEIEIEEKERADLESITVQRRT
ncbi:Cytochrome b-c1 complex subunit 7 [Neophaeococcomyces mojaviensis]|uniref:Cytochrome b-c1 complex subunit 7 n=1 Tax=Neophaeococcomyces mojaviensis TaxID=3383035 RepID=A0ACC3AEB3_9EURO|nr:Cytochrome b-c1 complex subunit 7 [Knufia sp. JES_112]